MAKRTALITFIIFLFFGSLSAQDINRALINSSGCAEKYPGSRVLVLYDSSYVRVKESGLSYAREHKLVKILTPLGAKIYASVNLNYDPLSADIEVLSAKIYRKSGKVIEIKKDNIFDYPAPARMIYWGARNKTIQFGRLEPGDAVEIITMRKGFTYALLLDENEDERFIPPMRGHFYDIVPFWVSNHTLEKTYCVEMPSGKPLQFRFYNGGAESKVIFGENKRKEAEVLINPHKKVSENKEIGTDMKPDSGKTLYCWTKKDMAPFKGESDMVAASDVAPKLLLSTSPDWKAKSLWFYGVNEDFGSFEVTPEVQNMTDALLEGVDDEIERIKILTHWVAEEIRYSGISMGKGEGYTLHPGAMTFSDRCGVCKDKAGMLVTMLRAAGFESYPAMTMAGSRIEKIPADQFNHSVTVAKLKNGKWILLDPTWVPGVRELWSSAEQQQQYLMGIPEGSDLKTTPISPPENHYWKLNVKSGLSLDGTLKGRLTLEAEGQSDALIRRAFSRSYRSSWEETIPSYFSEKFPAAKVSNISYVHPVDISKPMKIELEFEIPEYAVYADGKMIFTPLSALNPFDDRLFSPELSTNISLENREYGFRVRCSKKVNINETMELPEGYKPFEIPTFETVKDENSASFSAEYKLSGDELVLSAEHFMEKRLYNAEDWVSFRTALAERKKLMNSKIILEK